MYCEAHRRISKPDIYSSDVEKLTMEQVRPITGEKYGSKNRCFSPFANHSIWEEDKHMASMEAEDAASDGTDDDELLDLTHLPV